MLNNVNKMNDNIESCKNKLYTESNIKKMS